MYKVTYFVFTLYRTRVIQKLKKQNGWEGLGKPLL